MEMILALVVVIAVIIFGALISMGNERQRRAIDTLREQIVLWALNDLRIKREQIAKDLKIDNPLSWLNKLAGKYIGSHFIIKTIEPFDNPQTLICTGEDGRRIAFSPASLADIRQLKRGSKNKLLNAGNQHPLAQLPTNIERKEISILNGGILFDRELSITWNVLSGGQELGEIDSLYLYLFP